MPWVCPVNATIDSYANSPHQTTVVGVGKGMDSN